MTRHRFEGAGLQSRRRPAKGSRLQPLMESSPLYQRLDPNQAPHLHPHAMLIPVIDPTPSTPANDYPAMLRIALEEARTGLAEGGLPIGAAIFRADGTLVSRGHN